MGDRSHTSIKLGMTTDTSMSHARATIEAMTVLGAIFPPDLPPERLRPVAQHADETGLEQLWLWEDCFKESGIAAAGAALAWTTQLTLGVGLLPVPLRNVALTAMELATLERLFPGRIVPGVGHGVLDWMGQVGARAESPMTLLREYTLALRALLHGETVSTEGRYVRLQNVALDWPPQPAPPVLVGAVGPRTVALAGERSDGVILDGQPDLDRLRNTIPALAEGLERSGRDAQLQVVQFLTVPENETADYTAARIREIAAAGVTHAILLAVADGPPVDPPLERFVDRIVHDIRPLVP